MTTCFTGYGLDGPGIESQWGRDFPHLWDRTWGPPSLLYNGYRVFPGGKERPGRDADPSPPSSAVGHERIELYLYSPYGQYGLYRASVPVQGWPLPYLLHVWVWKTIIRPPFQKFKTNAIFKQFDIIIFLYVVITLVKHISHTVKTNALYLALLRKFL